ncbi:MAG: zinc dependent phospholipase C family protein [Spirochaetaceae bacterium]|jgi:hypothetical protein|nr:zinc dependent phospholipase C family protein [Spirochaetaceae bacterium]
MPSQILHTLFGEDVITAIYQSLAPRFGPVADRALEKIRGSCRNAFALGCQGPDIFYHSQGRRPVGLEYGTLLHRRGAGAFTAELLKMGLPGPEEGLRREREINALGAYALGFMTHAILDRAAHPYIIYKSRYHVFFERIIDVLMLRELREKEAASWDQEAILARICEEPPVGLKELLARALILAFPERAGRDGKLMARIDNTFADCARFYRLTSPRRTSLGGGVVERRVLELLYPEKLEEDIDFLNLKKEPWYYPAGNSGENYRSFPELYAGAVARAASVITPVIAGYLETGIFPIGEAARAIGNGGLSIQDDEGRPCAPTRSAPLPLDRTLRRQEELRGAFPKGAL